MTTYSREDIVRLVQENDVEFIRLQFTDIYGNLKNMAVTTSQLEKLLNGQCAFPGMAVDGLPNSESSSLYLHPDYSTFATFPWRPQQERVARLICDIYREDGTPFEGDSRGVLKRAIARADAMGYRFLVAPECEFFLFDYDENGNPTISTADRGNYFDVGPADTGENARRDIILSLEDMGIKAASSFHSEGHGQHEIDLTYEAPLVTADNLTTFKLVVRTMAKRYGLYGTFLPKPNSDEKGSGMHFKICMYEKETGRNCFKGENGALSREESAFIAGLMAHMEGLCLITNPLINSYKRFQPGFDAPTHIGWSRQIYNSLINLGNTDYKTNKIELRSPDGASNSYLALAAVLSAGLDGIAQGMQAGPGDLSIRRMRRLPANLGEALKAFVKDDFLQEVLGPAISQKLLQGASREWEQYNAQVMDWEIKRYLPLI